MDYNIKLDSFEGPFDLLLHLIKKNNINIYDISIDKITKDYFDYLNKMEKLNINIASSYLVLASELMLIKSNSLLPQNNQKEEDDDESLDREGLIQKLIDYEKYKNITSFFKDKEIDRQKIFTKAPENISNYILSNTKSGESVDNLRLAFEDFLIKKNEEKPITTKVTTKEYDLKTRKDEIKGVLKRNKNVFFSSLFNKNDIPYLIITFLAILDMVKDGLISVVQNKVFEDFIIERRNS